MIPSPHCFVYTLCEASTLDMGRHLPEVWQLKNFNHVLTGEGAASTLLIQLAITQKNRLERRRNHGTVQIPQKNYKRKKKLKKNAREPGNYEFSSSWKKIPSTRAPGFPLSSLSTAPSSSLAPPKKQFLSHHWLEQLSSSHHPHKS
jgi:hypothetical protein